MYGAFIASVRRSRGLTQAQLAEVSGVQQSNISAIEQDRRQPSAATLHRLVHACGFELLASAGELVVACPPPVDDDLLVDLLVRGELDDEPLVTHRSPNETRVEVLTAVLEASEAAVRAR
ncbi:MAG: helix-turn-helix domain-containing protein [Actinomycetota bacterium]|nr:helix-turn-helix domain-containing protein [Actinomycetota bacterium]